MTTLGIGRSGRTRDRRGNRRGNRRRPEPAGRAGRGRPARRWTRGPVRRRSGGERGSLAVFVVLFSVAVLVMVGLLVDGGASINARLRAGDIAEQAARAAADTVDVERLRATGEVRISSGGRACGRAREVVRAHGEAGAVLTRCAVAVGAQRVTTQVRVEWRAFFLTIIGFTGGTMAAEASAGPRTD